MSSYPFIDTQKGFYSSYWDTGLYGNYFKCAPERVKEVMQRNSEAYAGMMVFIQSMPIK